MLTDIEKAIREYLPEVIHMSLATSANNRPWITEVHYVFDAELNFYFRSLASRRHSLEIEQNENVSGSIVKQYSVGQKPRGVFFEGKAEMLNDIDTSHIAYKLYCERFGTDEKIVAESQTAAGHKFYKISVSKFFVFDSIETNPSQKYELNWGR